MTKKVNEKNFLWLIVKDWEDACNALAREFERVLLRDYNEPESEEYEARGQWIGDVGELYDVCEYYTVSVDEMATLLKAITDGKLKAEDAYERFTTWYDLMLKAASLRSDYSNKALHFVSLKSWLNGVPVDGLVKAVEEASELRERYEQRVSGMLKKYPTKKDNGFQEHFNDPKKWGKNPMVNEEWD